MEANSSLTATGRPGNTAELTAGARLAARFAWLLVPPTNVLVATGVLARGRALFLGLSSSDEEEELSEEEEDGDLLLLCLLFLDFFFFFFSLFLDGWASSSCPPLSSS